MSDGSTKTLTAGEYTLAATQDGAAVALDEAFAKAGKVNGHGHRQRQDRHLRRDRDGQGSRSGTRDAQVHQGHVQAGQDTYTVDETFAKTGLAVTGTWSDGKTALLKDGEYKLSAVDADGKTVDLTKPFTARATSPSQ